jgi:hypothetical protein
VREGRELGSRTPLRATTGVRTRQATRSPRSERTRSDARAREEWSAGERWFAWRATEFELTPAARASARSSRWRHQADVRRGGFSKTSARRQGAPAQRRRRGKWLEDER